MTAEAENNTTSAIHLYRPSLDIIRVVCMALIIIIEFGLGFIPYFAYAHPFLYFSQGTLFTVYGFLVLRDGADLTKNIKHALKVFLIMLTVYGLMTGGYLWLFTGHPLAGIGRRRIFNFVVLNYWGVPFCASIWYVQSTLYALIIFWLLRRWKEYDRLLCIVLFVFAVLVGELAGVIHFAVLRYRYIPGNFLTRVMPYMLLGRIIHSNYRAITRQLEHGPFFYFLGGLLMCVLEFSLLFTAKKLVYPNHFIGFIPMAAFLCIYGASDSEWDDFEGHFASVMYKVMYYIYNPLGYMLILAAGILCRTRQQYETCMSFMGCIVLVLTAGISLLFAFLKTKKTTEDKTI